MAKVSASFGTTIPMGQYANVKVETRIDDVEIPEGAIASEYALMIHEQIRLATGKAFLDALQEAPEDVQKQMLARIPQNLKQTLMLSPVARILIRAGIEYDKFEEVPSK